MAQLLSNLPVGAKVKFGKHQVNAETPWDITWLVVAKSHTGYPTNAITLLAEKCLNQLAFDAAEPDNADANRQAYGNNKYAVSNIDQWLNSEGAAWYVSRHRTDTPPSAEHLHEVHAPFAYADRSGFLYHFSVNERAAIQSTTIRVARNPLDEGGYEDVVRKVFLPSCTELINKLENNIAEGAQWEWFIKNPNTKCSLFPQAFNNALGSEKPTSATEDWSWSTRTPGAYDNGAHVRYFMYDGSFNTGTAYQASRGIRPAMNLSSTLYVSDTTDSDGCYTFLLNSAPPQPSAINIPATVYGGKSNAISWSKVTDIDGDIVTYHLECSINGGNYTQIYSGTSTSFAHRVPFGTGNIVYRVKATDPSGASSSYRTSADRAVVNNNAPVISGSDGNLGVKSGGFMGTYVVTDADNDTLTITESIDGVRIRAMVAASGDTITYGVIDNTWLALANGSHTLTCSVTDGIDTAVRTYVFTKALDSFLIMNSTPWASSTMPTRIMLVVTRSIPPTSTFKVTVCNNGYDLEPTWEDATEYVTSGLVYSFTNKNKAHGNWGVRIRVFVKRNGATGDCYVSAIGGNFE